MNKVKKRRITIAMLAFSTLFISLCFSSISLQANQSINNKLDQKRDLFSVCYPTAEQGWACGRWGTILHTSDGGLNWERQKTPTDYTLSDIKFIDTKHGWAVGDNGTILRTVDGGLNWVREKSPVPYFLMGVHFVDTEKGWIVTERTNILYTKDGGKCWTVQFKGEDFILKRISFFNSQNGWAVGEFGIIYHTSNGGQSWEKQGGGFDFSPDTGDIVGGSFLFDVVALGTSEAWVVGIDGYVAKTEDGGKTWKQVLDKEIPKTHLYGISANKKGNIVICGSGSIIIRNKEDGKFRKPNISPSIEYGWLYGIASKGDIGFTAVGRQGWIYLSENSEHKWQKTNIDDATKVK
jgi:photosystem II stability/assembly factor-like uncharacterized protein